LELVTGYAREDTIDRELLAKISEIDQTQIANEGNFQQVHFSISDEDSTGVYATLLVAAQQEVEVLKTASSRSSFIIDR